MSLPDLVLPVLVFSVSACSGTSGRGTGTHGSGGSSGSTTAGFACAVPGFAAPVTYAVGPSPNGAAVADFNGDGRPDLAATG